MATIRQMIINRAITIIMRSGDPDLSTVRIAAALEGALEGARDRDYYLSVPITGQANRRLIGAVRESVLRRRRDDLSQ